MRTNFSVNGKYCKKVASSESPSFYLISLGTIMVISIAFVLFAVQVDKTSAQGPDTAATLALDWLSNQQHTDGGYGSPGATVDTLLAVGANNLDPSTWVTGGNSLLDYWSIGNPNNAADYADDSAGTAGKLIVAVAGAGQNPLNFAGLNLVDRLTTQYDDATGSFNAGILGGIQAQAWGMLGWRAAFADTNPIPIKATDILLSHKNPDGGWGWASSFSSDSNSTAVALQALIAGGECVNSPNITEGLNYLKTTQNADGGFSFDSSFSSDTSSTAYVVQALFAAGEDPESSNWTQNGNTPIDYLLSMQLSDGSFEWQKGLGSDQFATRQAIPALLGQPFPLHLDPPNQSQCFDTTPPATITDLSASSGNAAGTVDLAWTAPGDDGTSGTASQYIVRYATSAITSEAAWNAATNVTGEPTPSPAGSAESMTVSGLTPGQTYYFAIKAQDEVPNTSGLSNSPSVAVGSEDGTISCQKSSAIYLPIIFKGETLGSGSESSVHTTETVTECVEVYEHTTDSNGVFSVPLTGGGQHTFQLKNLLDESVTGVRVLSAENEDGITLLILPQEKGYLPVVTSFPASQYSALISPQAFEIIRLSSLIENASVPVEQKIIYIAGHLEALLGGMSDIVIDSVSNIEVCDAVAVGTGVVLLVMHPPTSFGVVAEHGVIHVAVDQSCEILMHGTPGNFDFARYTGDGLQEVTILMPDTTVKNATGIAYGHVVDANTGLGITGVTVTLDGGSSQSTWNEGGYILQGLSAGTHNLSVSASGYDTATGTFNMVAGQVTYVSDLVLEAENPGNLRLVNNTTGVVTAEVETQEQVDIASGQSQDWVLPAGIYHIRVWTTACAGIAEADVTITAGDTLPLYASCGQAASVSLK